MTVDPMLPANYLCQFSGCRRLGEEWRGFRATSGHAVVAPYCRDHLRSQVTWPVLVLCTPAEIGA